MIKYFVYLVPDNASQIYRLMQRGALAYQINCWDKIVSFPFASIMLVKIENLPKKKKALKIINT